MRDSSTVTTIEEAREELGLWRKALMKASRKESRQRDRAARARSFVKHYEQQIASLEYPPEPMKVGAIVRFEKQYRGSTIVYRYAAIRSGGTWWCTGPTSPQGITWRDLVGFAMKDNRLLQKPALMHDASDDLAPPF